MLPRPPSYRAFRIAPVLILFLTVAATSPVAGLEGAVAATLAPCYLDGLATAVRCGTLEVPEDRAAPAGRMLTLHFAVVPARQREAAPDPLVLLAGGPGQGATTYGPLVADAFREVWGERDIVLLDQRGTGDSHPLVCAPADDELAAFAGGEALPVGVALCLAGLDADVRLYSNLHAAADLEALRAHLGYEKINLWGGSFGTRAALVYLRAYPQRVRTAVLDGAAPFELTFPLHNAAGAERALAQLAADCAADPDCHRAFPRFQEELQAVLASLDAAPARLTVPHPRSGAPRQVEVSRALFASGLRGFLYLPAHAAQIPFLVHAAAAGRFAPFLALSLETAAWSTETMSLGMTLSVVCSEDVARITSEEAERLTRGTFLGSGEIELWQRMCAAWPQAPAVIEAAGPAPPVDVPALILSGALDPVTPPRWGEVMASHLPQSLTVVVPGAAHNTTTLGCVPRLIADFIDRATIEGLDASCVEAMRRPPFVLGPAGPAP